MNIVRRLREEKKITQAKLAELAKINVKQIQKYEYADCKLENMTLRNSVSLANALGCNVEDFLKKE